MLKNYFKIAFRTLLRQPGYSFVNIAGLALGLACCLLILLYIQEELRYDRHHQRAERLYRVTASYVEGNHWAPVGPPIGFALKDRVPEIEQAARVFPFGNETLLRYEDRQFAEDNGLYADSTIFSLFTIRLASGNESDVLSAPNAIVLSQRLAQKLFVDANPIGQMLTVNDELELVVTGVMENQPAATHLPFEFLVSMRTFYNNFGGDPDQLLEWSGLYTYVLLREDVDVERLAGTMQSFVASFFADRFDEPAESVLKLILQPVTDIHLYSRLEKEYRPNSDIVYVYAFGLIAVLVLLIACVNFVNLTTARAGDRMREVGVRKALGSLRRQLIVQFMGESLVLSGLACVLAGFLVTLSIPILNQLTGQSMNAGVAYTSAVLGGLACMALLSGLLSGLYPALFISGFSPFKALKGMGSSGADRVFLRKGLVVFQFSISIFLIASTFVVYSQLRFFRDKQLGFDKEGIVNVHLNGQLETYVRENLETVKSELLRHSAIQSVSLAADVPGDRFSLENISVEGKPDSEAKMMRIAWGVDHDYIKTLGVSLIDGRDFSDRAPADSNAWIINEAAVRRLDLEDPVGQVLRWGNYAGHIVGVAGEFNFASLHYDIEPLVIPLRPGVGSMLLVRAEAEKTPQALDYIERTLDRLVPHSFFRYSFVGDDFERLYRSEDRLGRVFSSFSMLSILIACLGLFGLAAYTAERRSKEIGIRKTLGASIQSILVLLAKEFANLVMLACVVAIPVTYLAMVKWLQDFAYRVDLNLWLFGEAALLVIGIAMATVGYQAIRAALSNPVDALRCE